VHETRWTPFCYWWVRLKKKTHKQLLYDDLLGHVAARCQQTDNQFVQQYDFDVEEGDDSIRETAANYFVAHFSTKPTTQLQVSSTHNYTPTPKQTNARSITRRWQLTPIQVYVRVTHK
jgi:hypothetical protein